MNVQDVYYVYISCIAPCPTRATQLQSQLQSLRMFEEKVGDQAVKAYFESMDLDVWDAARLSMARMADGSMKIYGRWVNGD